MNVCFVLPPAMRKIAGGYKVVYQYANYLSHKGVNVDIVYDSRSGDNSMGIPKAIMLFIRKIIMHMEPRWFDLNTSVNKRCVSDIKCNFFKENYDVIICTAIDTMIKCKKENIKNCIHFIQGHENMFLSDAEVEQVYKYNCPKIIVSNWLMDIIKKVNNNTNLYLVKNGVDTDIFNNKGTVKQQQSISMMFKSNNIIKNSEMGIRIFEKLKKEFPELQVHLFSTDKKPDWIPEWIKYIYNASEQQVGGALKQSQIYVCTSNQEGYGLPPLEAMACGCVLVTTDNKGVMEYATDNYNALVSPIKDEDCMYDNLKKLLSDADLLNEMSKKTVNTAMNLSLQNQSEKFYEALLHIVKSDFDNV